MFTGSERRYWMKYDENMASRDAWATDLLESFYEKIHHLRDAMKKQEEQMARRSKSEPEIVAVNGIERPNHLSEMKSQPTERKASVPQHLPQERQKLAERQQKPRRQQQKYPTEKRLLESCFVFRLNDFTIYQVSSAADSRNSKGPKKFIGSEKKTLWLPPEMSSVHVELTEYYYPEGIVFPGN